MIQSPPRDFAAASRSYRKCRQVLFLAAWKEGETVLRVSPGMLYSANQFAIQAAQLSDIQGDELNLQVGHKLPYIDTFRGQHRSPGRELCPGSDPSLSCLVIASVNVRAFCGPNGALCRAWTWRWRSHSGCPHEGIRLQKVMTRCRLGSGLITQIGVSGVDPSKIMT
jgi:hypothetical protein